jgi:hypothetical protein
MDERDDEMEGLIAAAGEAATPELIARLVERARQSGARALFTALDREGDVRPCGQGCGWEGPWSVESTLWPADRERLLGAEYRPAAQLAEAEELARLRPAPRR